MLLDLVNIRKVRRAIVYFGLILAALFLQNTILAKMPIFGVTAMVIPCFAVAAAFFEGGVWGCVFGLVLGIFYDLSLAGTSLLFTILLPIIGFASGSLVMFFINRRLLSFFLVSAAALIITAFCQMFALLVFSETKILPLLLTGALQVLWALPLSFAAYYSCRKISRLDLGK